MSGDTGRPPLYETPEEMQIKIDEYFALCDAHTKEEAVKTRDGVEVVTVSAPLRYTVAGLAYHLGFSARTSFADTAVDRPQFSDTITRARLKIESQRSQDIADPDTKNNRGIIFDLVNNHGWTDKKDVNLTGIEPVIIEDENGKSILTLGSRQRDANKTP